MRSSQKLDILKKYQKLNKKDLLQTKGGTRLTINQPNFAGFEIPSWRDFFRNKGKH